MRYLPAVYFDGYPFSVSCAMQSDQPLTPPVI